MNTEFCWPDAGDPMPSGVRTSLLLEAFALAHGVSTVRIGAEGFMGGRAPDFSALGFHETISLETSRSFVRTCGDRVARRSALREAGIRVPTARSFGFAQAEQAGAFGEQFRHGALVKPRSVESGRARRRGLHTQEEIRESLTAWREQLGGHISFLVEQRVTGREHAFHVVGGRVVSVVRLRNGFWAEEVFRSGANGFGEIAPEVLDHAVTAFQSLPAAPHGHVRIISRDIRTRPGVVVSVKPQPVLVGRRPPAEWGRFMAAEMIGHALREVPWASDAPQERVLAELRMSEVDEPAALVTGARRRLAERGIAGEAEIIGDRGAGLWVQAAPGAVAALAGAAKRGRFGGGAPLTVTTTLG